MKEHDSPLPQDTADAAAELITRFFDQATRPEDAAALKQLQDAHPLLEAEKQQWQRLGDLLRAELPREQEPESPDFFNSQIMSQLQAQTVPQRAAPQKLGWFQRWQAWWAPLATSAALLVAGLFLLKRPVTLDSAVPYSPDPNVRATLSFHEEANATVLDLENLSLNDAQEIRPYSIVSALPAEPGQPQRFYASHDPARLVLLMHQDENSAPRIREISYE